MRLPHEIPTLSAVDITKVLHRRCVNFQKARIMQQTNPLENHALTAPPVEAYFIQGACEFQMESRNLIFKRKNLGQPGHMWDVCKKCYMIMLTHVRGGNRERALRYHLELRGVQWFILQSCTKFVGTHALLIITTSVSSRYMCTKWHVWFNIHFLSIFPSPPSPTKQWYMCRLSFAVHYPWQHWFWGVGNRVFITKCPNSFIQDCSCIITGSRMFLFLLFCLGFKSLHKRY